MSLLSLINETFKGREPGTGLYIWTRGGSVLAGTIRHCDNRGLVLETADGVVLVMPRAIVAISDRREALKNEAAISAPPPPAG